jgi:hypothetical protein
VFGMNPPEEIAYRACRANVAACTPHRDLR